MKLSTAPSLLILLIGFCGLTSASAQPLAVTHPNGRERFESGDTITIDWLSETPADLVRLSFSADGGATWTLITGQATGGSYRWALPTTPTGDALIRAERWEPDTVVGVREFPRARGVYKAAFVTSDGRRVVIAELLPGHPGDSEILIYDAVSRQLVARRVFPSGSIFDVDASPDGRLLYVATLADDSGDTSVVVLDAATASVLGGLRGHPGGASSIDASADGRLLATGGYDPEVRIWDVGTKAEIKKLEGFERSVGQVALDPMSKWLAAASGDEGIKVFDTESWQQRQFFERDSAGTSYGEVRDLEFASDGRRLLSVSYPYGISIFDVETGRQILRRAVASGTSHASMSPDGRLVASGRDTIHIWDSLTGRTRFTLPRPIPGLAQIGFAPDGAGLLTLGRDSVPRLWLLSGPVVESDQSDRTWGIGMTAAVEAETAARRGLMSISALPASSRIVVRFTTGPGTTPDVTIVDLLGHTVARLDAGVIRNDELLLDVAGLRNGAYFVIVRADGVTTVAPMHWQR
jgi:WD40 repeat protein